MEVGARLWPPRATRLPPQAPKPHSCAQAGTLAQGSVGVTPQALPRGTWGLPTEYQGKKT